MSSFKPLHDWRRRNVFSPAPSSPPAPPLDSAAIPVDEPGPGSLEERVRHAHGEGLAAGRAESVDRERARAFETLATAAQTIRELHDGYLSAHRREVVELALAIAETVLGRPPCDDADALAGRIDRALSSVEPDGALKLRLSPRDHALVESDGASELGRCAGDAAIETCVDPELAPGEFRLEAGPAEADGRRATLLAALRERLIESLGEESS